MTMKDLLNDLLNYLAVPRFPKFLMPLLLTTAMASTACAQFYDGHSLKASSVQDIVAQVKPGTILILGENHGQISQQAGQMELIKALREMPYKLSVGLEFMWYTDNKTIENYRLGQISEEEFLKSWRGGFSFDLYKAQLIVPILDRGEFSLGLNLPSRISSKIGKVGLEGLNDEEKSFLPPNFTLGRESYRKRFVDQMGGHGGPNIDKYFAAQSAWDDTMAWQSVNFMKEHPDQVLVIVVGEFHVQYGGGLPDRLQSRLSEAGLNTQIVTLSQIMTYGQTEDEIKKSIIPSVIEGPRADFIFLDSAKPMSLKLF